MKIFSSTANQPLAEKIAKRLDLPLSSIETHVFPDGERRVKIEGDVSSTPCVVVAPTSPPVDNNIIELCLILDALKNAGATKITAIVPYLGYQRQDHIFRTGEGRSLEVVIKMIEACGADAIVGVDFHSIKIPELFSIPVTHISAVSLFAKKIKNMGVDLSEACIVSPDMGGLRRLEALKEELGGIETVSVEKDRDVVTGEIKISGVHGNVKKVCFVVDDMISSGGTIVEALKKLQENGAERMFVMVTHPVFSEKAPEILEQSLAEKVFVTDSIFIPEDRTFPKLEVLSLSEDIAESLT